MILGCYVLAADMEKPGGYGTPSTPGGPKSKCSSPIASPTHAPKQQTPTSNTSKGLAVAIATRPTIKPVSCSPALPDARREPIDAAGHHG